MVFPKQPKKIKEKEKERNLFEKLIMKLSQTMKPKKPNQKIEKPKNRKNFVSQNRKKDKEKRKKNKQKKQTKKQQQKVVLKDRKEKKHIRSIAELEIPKRMADGKHPQVFVLIWMKKSEFRSSGSLVITAVVFAFFFSKKKSDERHKKKRKKKRKKKKKTWTKQTVFPSWRISTFSCSAQVNSPGLAILSFFYKIPEPELEPEPEMWISTTRMSRGIEKKTHFFKKNERKIACTNVKLLNLRNLFTESSSSLPHPKSKKGAIWFDFSLTPDHLERLTIFERKHTQKKHCSKDWVRIKNRVFDLGPFYFDFGSISENVAHFLFLKIFWKKIFSKSFWKNE